MQPKLRFEKFNETWESVSFSDIYTFLGTNSLSRADLVEKSDSVNDILNIHYGDIHKKYNSFINLEKVNLPYIKQEKIPNKIDFCIDGDLIIADASEDYADIGKSVELFNIGGKKVVAGLHTFLARPNRDKIANFFMAYQMQTLLIRRQIRRYATGISVLGIAKRNLMNVEFYLPRVEEQTKIANFLSAVEQKITILEKQQQAWEQYKQGMMQKLFSGELRFRDENGEDFPEWEECFLGDISYITTGSSNRQDSSQDEGEYVFFDRSQDIRRSNRYLFDKEAVIIGGEGQEFRPKYFIGKFDLHQRAYAVMDFEKALAKFIFYYFEYYKNYFLSVAVGSTVKSLRLPMFQQMPINLPSFLEQSKIVNFFNVVDSKIESITQNLERQRIWKDGLLQQMFI